MHPKYDVVMSDLGPEGAACTHFISYKSKCSQPGSPLSGCYYGDASSAKTKAVEKISSLRPEPVADS